MGSVCGFYYKNNIFKRRDQIQQNILQNYAVRKTLLDLNSNLIFPLGWQKITFYPFYLWHRIKGLFTTPRVLYGNYGELFLRTLSTPSVSLDEPIIYNHLFFIVILLWFKQTFYNKNS